MDEIEELIAAGESILAERHVSDENLLLKDVEKNIKFSDGSGSGFIYNSQHSTLIDKASISTDENCCATSQQTQHDSIVKVVSSIKEEFAKVFSVGLTVNATLVNANRLVRAVLKRFCKDSQTSQQILEEVQQCEESCDKNADTFSKLAGEMQCLLAEMNNLSNKQEDQAILMTTAEKKVLSLRDMIADLITDTGFKDIAKQIISPRASLIDLIEDSHLGLTLLSGELPNHVAKYQNDLLQKNHLQELHLKKEFTHLQQEYDQLVQNIQKEKTRLQIQIEKLQSDVTSYESQLKQSEQEKETLNRKFEEELKKAEAVAAQLREDIVSVEQAAQLRVSLAEDSSRDAAQNEDILQAKVTGLSQQLITKDDDMHQYQHEKTTEIKTLTNYIKKLESDVSKEKSQTLHAEDVRKEFIDNKRKLEISLEEALKHIQSSNDEIKLLKSQSKKLKDSHGMELTDLQEKVTELSSTLCDKHSEVRSRDVKILQLQTDLQLEEQKIFVANNESGLLRKQIDRLQGRIEQMIENRPKGERAVLLHTDEASRGRMEQTRDLTSERIHNEMQRLLTQKDEEMAKLQDSLSSDILKKNNELERLSKFVERLEEQMIDVTSALSLSNGMAVASTRVASHLQKHSSALTELQESSAKLRMDCNGIVKENTGEDRVLSQFKEDINSYRSATQKARDEARAARLELAKEKQKNSYLQIDLESARSVIEQKERLRYLPASRSLADSKCDLTSEDSISTVLGNSEMSTHI